MSKEQPENITEMMDLLRGLRSTLEGLIAESIRTFEAQCGLTVEDIELIRHVTMDGKAGTEVVGVKIEMKL